MNIQEVRTAAMKACVEIESRSPLPSHAQAIMWAQAYERYILTGAVPKAAVGRVNNDLSDQVRPTGPNGEPAH